MGPVDLNPPRGTWFQEESNGFIVGATTRHVMAFFIVPFMCVWSGGSLGVIYGTQIMKGKFDLVQSLFGIPFFLGTLLFGSIALMTVCGKVIVQVLDSDGTVFTGVGPFGWRRRFDPQTVTAVRVESYFPGHQPQTASIVLDGANKLRFASGLTEARRDFIAKVLLRKLNNEHRGTSF